MGNFISYLSYHFHTNPETNLTDYETDELDVLDCSDIVSTRHLKSEDSLHAGSMWNSAMKTDATGTSTTRNTQIKCSFTAETVRYVEYELGFYEKVSLVFLLYDNEDVALEWILKESSNIVESNQATNLIYEWARAESKKSDSDFWKLKFIEALAIIQNYAMLHRLGYEKKEMQLRFLPSNTSTVLYVDLQRKALYYICENLGIKHTNIFLDHLKKAFSAKSIRFQEFDCNYLELYFLYCASMKFITKTDYTNLIKIFKHMSQFNICDILEYITNNRNENTTDLSNVKQDDVSSAKPLHFDLQGKYNKQMSSPCPDHSVASTMSHMSARSLYSDDECYPIDPKNVGVCLVINQEIFHECEDPDIPKISCSFHKLENRDGTERDRDKISSTFKKLGYKVIVRNNRKHSEMLQDIKDAINTFSRRDSSFVLFILSHGEQDIVFGTDSVTVNVSDIIDLLYASNVLLDKPKVVFIQSCQGKELQKAVLYNDNIRTDGIEPVDYKKIRTSGFGRLMPRQSDLLLCWSTVPGFASVRNRIEGTWFIQDLCDTILKDCHRTHLLDMLISVTKNVSEKVCEKNGEFVCMVPKYEATLKKRLFLQMFSDDYSKNNADA